VIGTSRTPASPASAPPSAQLPIDSRPGDQPSAAMLCSLCATAVVAMPNLVNLYAAHSAAVSATVHARMMMRSSPIATLPHSVMRPLGRKLVTKGAPWPHCSMPYCRIAARIASVATTRAMGEAFRSGRMIRS